MKANELRIGNMIYHHMPDRVKYIRKISMDGAHIANKDGGNWAVTIIEHISPIPLTEAWLLKFGFITLADKQVKIYGKSYFIEDKFENLWIIINSMNDCCIESDSILDISIPIGEVKTVHQLQNLYFALTGEELTLNHSKV